MTTPCKNCSDYMPFTPNPCMNDECEYKLLKQKKIYDKVKEIKISHSYSNKRVTIEIDELNTDEVIEDIVKQVGKDEVIEYIQNYC